MSGYYYDRQAKTLLGFYSGPDGAGNPYDGHPCTDTPPTVPGMVWDDGAWVPPPPDKLTLKQLAAQHRWERETGGITIGGIPVKTDRESQSLIMGAHITASITHANVKWKSDAGFVELTPDQITGMALAVSAHVQACFTAEANILPLIEDGTIATVDAVLLWEGWPQ